MEPSRQNVSPHDVANAFSTPWCLFPGCSWLGFFWLPLHTWFPPSCIPRGCRRWAPWTTSLGQVGDKKLEQESERMDGEGRVFATPPPCLPGFHGLAVHLHLRPSSCQGPSPSRSSHLSSLSCLLHLRPELLRAVLPLTHV